MNMVKVSVIVLTYNNFKNIEENLKSISDQDFDDYEVIISDDGSENFDGKRIERVIQKYGIVNYKILHNKRNIGTVRNYERAISESSGKYIIPLSQDDIFYSSNVITQIVNYFELFGCEFLVCKSIGSKSCEVNPRNYDWECYKRYGLDGVLKRCILSNYVSGSCLYFKKEAFNAINGFDKEFTLLEDYPLVLRILMEKKKVDFFDIISIRYGENGVSSQKVLSKKLRTDYIKNMEKYLLPNLNIYKTKLAQRYVKRRYEVLKRSDSIINRFFLGIKYFDLSIVNIVILMKRASSDEIFTFLLEREFNSR